MRGVATVASTVAGDRVTVGIAPGEAPEREAAAVTCRGCISVRPFP